MKFTRFIAFLVLLCITVLAFSSCNGASVETQNSDTLPPTESPTGTPTSAPTSSTKPKPTEPADLGYDDSELYDYIEIPRFNGKNFQVEESDLGQGSYMNIASRADLDDYNEYLLELEDWGFFHYTSNQIGENFFDTYITRTQIVNVMYIDSFSQVRVIVDDRDVFDLPILESANVYEELGNQSLTLVSDEAIGWPGRMGYIYKLADGSFFIIDGGATSWVPGTGSSAEVIMNVLTEYADNPNNIRIAGWLITHIHEDHMGGFYDMSKSKKYTDKITIEKLIYNQPSKESAKEQDIGAYTHDGLTVVCELMETAIENWQPKQVYKAHPGQVFYIRDLTATVYYSQELLMFTDNTSSHNNSSVVTMVEFMDKTALYLGDVVYDANQKVVAPVYKEALKSDILQVAHHGYGDTGAEEVYTYSDPTIVFWPVYSYHYYTSDNYWGVKDLPTNQVLFKNGVKHYHHGEDCVTFSDFNTWEGERWDAVR